MSDLLQKLGINIPEGEQPEWVQKLVLHLEEKDAETNLLKAEIANLHQAGQTITEKKKPEMLPAFEVPTDSKITQTIETKGMANTYTELEIPKNTPPFAPDKTQETESLFEEPESEEEELDPRYNVMVDRDLEFLIPQFYTLRYQEIKDYGLWVPMESYLEIAETAFKSRGAALTFGFDYLAKLLWALAVGTKKPNRKKLEKIVFEISFYMDQVRITYV